MVFEGTAVNRLNELIELAHLGSLVEKVKISDVEYLSWHQGEVVLRNITLKPSALNAALNLPVKIVASHIGEVVMKIPLTNFIYASRAQVNIKKLYVLATPIEAVAFNPDEENIFLKEAIAKQLTQIEESKLQELAGDGSNQPEDEGFAAKLITQVIQNLHITVENVHIRYEDPITNPERPFAMGITLKKLFLESTDSFWKAAVISEPSKQFFKLLYLESLSIYCLSDASQLVCKMTPSEQVDHFREGIADAHSRPYENSYIASPFNSHAKLRINTRPELDGSNFTIPIISLNFTIEDISMGLTPHQYQDVVHLLNHLEKAKQHMEDVRKYVTLYKSKLTQDNEDQTVEKRLDELKEKLSETNIALARQLAADEVQADRIQTGLRLTEEAKKNLREMPSEINRNGNAVPAIYPRSFVKNRYEVSLTKLEIILRDPTNERQPVILLSSLSEVKGKVEHRPVAKGLHVEVKLGDFTINGSSLNNSPNLVRRLEADQNVLTTFVYETNPMDESCDQKIILFTEPLLITFEAPTIKQTLSFFQFNEAIQPNESQVSAASGLEAFKETISQGLEYAKQNHALVDVKIQGSLLIPCGGSMETNRGQILFNTSNFFIKNLEIRELNETQRVSQLMRIGSTEEDIPIVMMNLSHDKLKIGLEDVSVISVLQTEDWRVLLEQDNQDCFILKPMSIDMDIEKCIVLDDPRLPKLKMSFQLPSIHLNLVDIRLVNMAAVGVSILSATLNGTLSALPATAAPQLELSAHLNLDDPALEHSENVLEPSMIEQGQLVQAIELEMRFELKDIRISLAVMQSEIVKQVGAFVIENLEVTFAQKTFEAVVELKLQDFTLNYIDHVANHDIVTLISSRDDPKDLLSINFVDVNKLCPEFRFRHKSVMKKMEVVISSLAFDFRQEAIIDLLHISSDITSRIEALYSSPPAELSLLSALSNEDFDNNSIYETASSTSDSAAPASVSSETTEPSLHSALSNEDFVSNSRLLETDSSTLDSAAPASVTAEPLLQSTRSEEDGNFKLVGYVDELRATMSTREKCIVEVAVRKFAVNTLCGILHCRISSSMEALLNSWSPIQPAMVLYST